MELQLFASTNRLSNKSSLERFSQICARVCYSEKDLEELKQEKKNPSLIERLIKSGHHSPFEHIWFSFYFKGIPKIMAMVLNNEKQYVTSEKSARYTQMSSIESFQKEKYDKWMDILMPLIDKAYPFNPDTDAGKRATAIKKLAQENARYMTSVFTPTKMVYTVNLRQLNFLFDEFEKFIDKHESSRDIMKKRISESMKKFVNELEFLKISGLKNQTDRGLSMFSDLRPEKHFGVTYSTNYLLSFAALAQAHRHRTINYNIIGGAELNAPYGFFVPQIISDNPKLVREWINDLKKISEYDFPQAQLVRVMERGTIEDFRSKTILRICGAAQYEIMANTLEVAKNYKSFQEMYGEKALTPKCMQGMKCNSPCVWGGKKALERIV